LPEPFRLANKPISIIQDAGGLQKKYLILVVEPTPGGYMFLFVVCNKDKK